MRLGRSGQRTRTQAARADGECRPAQRIRCTPHTRMRARHRMAAGVAAGAHAYGWLPSQRHVAATSADSRADGSLSAGLGLEAGRALVQ